jgi:hypothetical protein
MTDFANAFPLVYAGLFPIMNPIGSAPISLCLTSSRTETNALARRLAINSILLLKESMFIGSHLLVFFGITLPVVRIAGGLVPIAFGRKLFHGGTESPFDGGRFFLSINARCQSCRDLIPYLAQHPAEYARKHILSNKMAGISAGRFH